MDKESVRKWRDEYFASTILEQEQIIQDQSEEIQRLAEEVRISSWINFKMPEEDHITINMNLVTGVYKEKSYSGNYVLVFYTVDKERREVFFESEQSRNRAYKKILSLMNTITI